MPEQNYLSIHSGSTIDSVVTRVMSSALNSLESAVNIAMSIPVPNERNNGKILVNAEDSYCAQTVPNVMADNMGSIVLTGYTPPTTALDTAGIAPVSNTDTIPGAFCKVQGQILNITTHSIGDKSKIYAVSESGVIDVVSFSEYVTSNRSAGLAYDAAAAVDAFAAVDSALDTKANIDGVYDGMVVGNAKQLVSAVGAEDQTPYNFRVVGGGIETGDRATLSEIVGGTVCWNQLVRNGDFSSVSSGVPSYWTTTYSNGSTMTVSNGKCTLACTGNNPGNSTYGIKQNVTIKAGHLYFTNFIIQRHLLGVVINNDNTFNAAFGNTNDGPLKQFKLSQVGDIQEIKWLEKFNNNYTRFIIRKTSCKPKSASDIFSVWNVQIFDLTEIFGPTMANYLSDLGTEKVSSWFKNLFPKSFYQYDAGTLCSVNPTSYKLVGPNLYNGASGVKKAYLIGGYRYRVKGTGTSNSSQIIFNNEDVTLDNGYYIPSENGYLEIPDGDLSNTMVYLAKENEVEDRDWVLYSETAMPLYNTALNGIPHLDNNGKLYYDGDIYYPDGRILRKYEYRDYVEGDKTDDSGTMITDGTHTVCITTPYFETIANPVSYTSILNIEDRTTEEFIDNRDVQIPVGHHTLYNINLRSKIESMPDSPNDNGDYIMRRNNGQNAYAPLQIRNELPDYPTEPGTYTLQLTTSESDRPYLEWVSTT